MFKVNDYVVYGSTGVCLVVDIKGDEFIKNDETEYYILNPVYNNSNMTIMVPTSNSTLAMRSISTKEEVLSLIAAMPTMETLWIDDERQRSASYKAMLKAGKNEDLIKIIKTLYLEKETRSALGKKLTKVDEEIFAAAEKQLNQEFALVLDISPDEVVPYILQHIS